MIRGILVAALAIPLLIGGTFDKDAAPLLRQTCTGCHNEKLASGGLNIGQFLDAASIGPKREGWERIIAKLRSGEMPPKGIPRPSAPQIDALVQYVQGEFERIDKSTPINPGRVTAHRLNRSEYSNTIRDLLGVNFRAQDEFPADDSGYGFDNIGDVLTVSPTLMEKYLSAAERIASRAVGGDPLPKPGIFSSRKRVQRLGPGGVQIKEVVDYDAEYIVRALLVGHR